MLEFFKAGGFPMFIVLAVGLIAIVASALFARRPEASKVEAIRALTFATLCSVAVGVASDLATVGYSIPKNPEWANDPKVHLIVLEGFAESMSPLILGLSLLSVVWLIMAVGYRRMRRTSGAAA